MMIQWRPNMRFKMAFETEDSSRISWCMGTISSVHFADPVHWPNSPWRLLQVIWDEPDALPNVSRVSPWLVELVSTFPVMHMSPFPLQPTKKYRTNTNEAVDGRYLLPSLSLRGQKSPLPSLSNSIPASIQGTRHGHIEQSGLESPHSTFRRFDARSKFSGHLTPGPNERIDDISCLPIMETATENSEKIDTCETPHFFLFCQPILTEQQMSRDRSSNDGPEEENITGKKMVSPSSSRSCSKRPAYDFDGSEITELGSDTGHCLVIMESEAVGRSLDLSWLGSYDELYRMLAKMFDKSETPAHVLYQDATGCTKHAGDEPFSIFMKTAKTIRILKGANGKSIGSNRAEGLTYGEN